ncbi:MAG: SIS domain-containing protein [candidate division Zixibacteria bacterium]|nr:SIS domain-containing protein [candidate division Zixibacteria bacterium]
MEDIIKAQLIESAELKIKLAEQSAKIIYEAAMMCVDAMKRNGKIMFCGNGGSAADSQHLATELVVRLTGKFDRPALPGLALAANAATLTACANDYGFEQVFARQIEAFGKSGDILFAISTSGNSANVIEAVKTARKMKIHTIGFLGGNGGQLSALADKPIIIPSDCVQRIQESHITIGHIIIGIIEKEAF